VALDGDSVGGTGAIRERSSTTAEVKRMYVLAPFRGQGIGLSLLECGVQFAHAKSPSEK
jgi:GNAT superfamily N-acetyltransferase